MNAKSEYLLLLRQPNTGPGPTPDELKLIMSRFAVWIQGLRDHDQWLSSNGLQNTGKMLSGTGGQMITDGPYQETKEIVGGYVLIKAESFEQAMAVAKACPGLDYRMTIEVRPVMVRPNA